MTRSTLYSLFFLTAFLFSCRTSSVFTKRKYTSGHCISFAKKASQPEQKHVLVRNEGPPASVHASKPEIVLNKKEVLLSPTRNNSVLEANAGEVSFSSLTPKVKVPLVTPQKKLYRTRLNRKAEIVSMGGGKLALGAIGFVLLTLIYFISILTQIPGINPIVALLVAMLFAGITVLTGVYVM